MKVREMAHWTTGASLSHWIELPLQFVFTLLLYWLSDSETGFDARPALFYLYTPYCLFDRFTVELNTGAFPWTILNVIPGEPPFNKSDRVIRKRMKMPYCCLKDSFRWYEEPEYWSVFPGACLNTHYKALKRAYSPIHRYHAQLSLMNN